MSFKIVDGVRVWGESEGKQPGWPCKRGYDLVGRKHEWQNDTSLTTPGGIPNNGNIKNWIAPGKILADLGCGTGQFAREIKDDIVEGSSGWMGVGKECSLLHRHCTALANLTFMNDIHSS